MDKYLAILARIGTDNPPSVDELSEARDGIARALHAQRKAGATDLAALTALRDAYQVADRAVAEAQAALAAQAAELDEALSGVPDPDASAPVVADPDPAPVTASAVSVAEAVARLGITVGKDRPAEPAAPDLAATTVAMQVGGRSVADPTWADLSQAFVASARNTRAGKETVLSVRTEFAGERSLTGQIGDDTALLDSFVSPEAVTAAGGCCSLPEPIRANPVAGSTARPIRASLATLAARAGQFTFYPAICDVDGVALWTCAQDAAVTSDEATWKVCAESECDEPITVGVEAIYTCRTVGNYKARFAREQWQAELQKLQIQQARVAEVALFTKMRAEVTTTHQLDATGSTYGTLMQGAALAAAAIRQDQRLGDVQLDLYLPEWIVNAMWADLLIRRFFNVDTLAATRAQIIAALGTLNINPVFSQDIDPIEAGSPGQVDGPLTAYPSTAHSVLAPSGYYTFLDGGQLDMGTEIRDFDLNRQNKLAAFSESFEGLLARGCNAKGLDIPVEVCANAPACPA